MSSIIQYVLYFVILVALAYPLGIYIKKVMNGEKTVLSKILTPMEKLIYKILHINQDLVLPKYAFYLMQATDIDHDNHQRYWISTYSQEIVALPPINEQERILTTLEHYYNLLDTLQ